jgi:hypothetical protein
MAKAANLEKGEWVKGVAHWRDGYTAYLSVAFTWRLPEARQIAEYYRAIGCHVIAGGPGLFTQMNYLADLCEIPTKLVIREGRQIKVLGDFDDALARHNPMATRASYGCPVGCHFCIVPKMDGKTFTLRPDFPVRPILCDDNLSALPANYQQHIIDRYLGAGVPLLDANSGFEPATFDDEVFARWKPILKGPWRFGFDEKTEGEAVGRVFKMLKDVSPRRKQVYTMIGHEPFDVCMDRIRKVIEAGAEPYAQPMIQLNSLKKEPKVRYDWTAQKLKHVQRWVNRRIWRYAPFSEYDASIKTNKAQR